MGSTLLIMTDKSKLARRLLADAQTSLDEAHRIANSLSNPMVTADIYLVQAAANQAAQAAKELYLLMGVLQ